MLLSVALLWLLAAPAFAQNPQTLFDRAVVEFEAGRFTESAVLFDRLAAAVPDRAAHLWQRGIALYYAERYVDCRRQFELHRTVNPDDVENAAWHFLCVARADSPAAARAALLPVGPDSRPPMREVYEMFRGTLTAEQVLAAAGAQTGAQFYARLYVGLFFDARGMTDQSLPQLRLAADDRFKDVGGYMQMVARVHVRARSR